MDIHSMLDGKSLVTVSVLIDTDGYNVQLNAVPTDRPNDETSVIFSGRVCFAVVALLASVLNGWSPATMTASYNGCYITYHVWKAGSKRSQLAANVLEVMDGCTDCTPDKILRQNMRAGQDMLRAAFGQSGEEGG